MTIRGVTDSPDNKILPPITVVITVITQLLLCNYIELLIIIVRKLLFCIYYFATCMMWLQSDVFNPTVSLQFLIPQPRPLPVCVSLIIPDDHFWPTQVYHRRDLIRLKTCRGLAEHLFSRVCGQITACSPKSGIKPSHMKTKADSTQRCGFWFWFSGQTVWFFLSYFK